MIEPASLLRGIDPVPTLSALSDEVRAAEADVARLRDTGRGAALDAALHRCALLYLLLGDGPRALEAGDFISNDWNDTPEYQRDRGQILCFVGRYDEAKRAFNRAHDLLPMRDDLQHAILELMLGALYYRVRATPMEALTFLQDAEPVLRGARLSYLLTAAWLTMADLHRALGSGFDASRCLEQAEALIDAEGLAWYRPLCSAVRGELALFHKDGEWALHFAQRGLAALDGRGDVRVLPRLYRLLATALEQCTDRITDACDARLRSVQAARTQAARIELALSLAELAAHYRTYSTRATLKARGAGYLYEAQKLFAEMGVAPLTGTGQSPA
jgi:tetratricopeptide (TPR) repeat protein